MPKLIEYPRTSYTGAWELAEIVDETGGKCTIDNAAKKMSRKVSGSFKAIIGSAVKFGLMTSKRELLSTTTLFKRIKHAYDKQEEMQFHREAFLAPPLFTQLCRKFRNRELPVQMLDVMLMREFNVEEINAQGVAKVFVDGCRMCGILGDNNVIADIETITNNPGTKRIPGTPTPPLSTFQPSTSPAITDKQDHIPLDALKNQRPGYAEDALSLFGSTSSNLYDAIIPEKSIEPDTVAALFELDPIPTTRPVDHAEASSEESLNTGVGNTNSTSRPVAPTPKPGKTFPVTSEALVYQLTVSGPGIDTSLDINDEADINIAIALMDKIRRRLTNS